MSTETRDGIEVVDIKTQEVVHFVPCTAGGSQRERVILGMFRNMREGLYLRDTRHED